MTLAPVRLTPDPRASEENVPSGELSNVMIFAGPNPATATSKPVAAVTELGAAARDPAPSSAPVNKVSPACAGAMTRAIASVATANIAPPVAIGVVTMI